MSVNAISYLQHVVRKVKVYNPLPVYFYSKMIFYTWRHYSNLTFDKLTLEKNDKKIFFESDDSDEEKNYVQETLPQNPNTSYNKSHILEIVEKPIQNLVSPLMGPPNIIVTKMI